MSGLCGMVRFDQRGVSDRDLERQTRSLAHLGPDAKRHRCLGPAGMGVVRMAATWEDAFDLQPLHDERGDLLFVCDARIDNREAIAAALGLDPVTLARMADSDLMFAAYRYWGADCAARLIGDFVFAAWETRTKTLSLGRDHMGQRHVFYYVGDGFIAFATERRGVQAAPEVPRQLPHAQIASILLRGSAGGRDVDGSALDPIIAVPGGSIVTLGAEGACAIRRYWRPCADPRHEDQGEAYYIDAYRRVLGEAVACRLRRACAPAGLMMSGGFDSAAIAALAGPIVTGQDRKLIAAASVMPQGYQGTIRHARPWVEACRRHMPHLDVRYVTREGLDLLAGMEARFLATDNGHSPNRYVTDALLSAIKAAGARTVMDGHGGDYTLNPAAQDFFIGLLRRGRLKLFFREWRARRDFLGVGHAMLFRTAILPHLAPALTRGWRRRRKGLKPFGQTMPVSKRFLQEITPYRAPRRRPSRSVRGAPFKALLEVLQDEAGLSYSFNAAAHGLEFTQPFHDKRVVELALAIPQTLYVKNGRERHLARTALADLYPPQFQTRRPAGEDLGPDFLIMAKGIEPAVLAQIDRMERAGKLSDYFDFPRMRKMLTRRRVEQHASGSEFDTRQAMLAFLWARYIEWFRGDNG